jgi:hypothetical protein
VDLLEPAEESNARALPRTRIECMGFQFREGPCKGANTASWVTAEELCGKASLVQCCGTIRNGPSETVTKLRVRTGHALAED